MIDKISKKILNMLSNEEDSDEQKEILLFGITRIVEDVPKYIAIIIICCFLGIIKEFCLVMFVTMLYKTFTGGVHLHTNIGCFIGSLLSTLMCIYIPKLLVNMGEYLQILAVLIYVFSIYIILVYVPADVPEVPIINEKRRKRDKIISFIILNLLYLLCFFIIKQNLYITTILISILNIDIMTTRSIYRLFKNKYGYETYIPDELLMTE